MVVWITPLRLFVKAELFLYYVKGVWPYQKNGALFQAITIERGEGTLTVDLGKYSLLHLADPRRRWRVWGLSYKILYTGSFV